MSRNWSEDSLLHCLRFYSYGNFSKTKCEIKTGMDEAKGTEGMERGSRKRSSSAGSEKMERFGDRKKWKDIVRQAKAHSGM